MNWIHSPNNGRSHPIMMGNHHPDLLSVRNFALMQGFIGKSGQNFSARFSLIVYEGDLRC